MTSRSGSAVEPEAKKDRVKTNFVYTMQEMRTRLGDHISMADSPIAEASGMYVAETSADGDFLQWRLYRNS